MRELITLSNLHTNCFPYATFYHTLFFNERIVTPHNTTEVDQSQSTSQEKSYKEFDRKKKKNTQKENKSSRVPLKLVMLQLTSSYQLLLAFETKTPMTVSQILLAKEHSKEKDILSSQCSPYRTPHWDSLSLVDHLFWLPTSSQ